MKLSKFELIYRATYTNFSS